METTAPAPTAPKMEAVGQLTPNAPEKMVREFKEPEKPNLESIQFQLKNLDAEVSTALTKINSIRAELGLPESNELPPALAKKQAKLLQAQNQWTMPESNTASGKSNEKVGEYIPFEETKNEKTDHDKIEEAKEIPDPEMQKKGQSEKITKTMEELFNEIKVLPKEELESFVTTGTYRNGALFNSKILGLIEPRTMQKLVLLAQESTTEISREMITTLKEKEPELFEAVEKHTEEKHDDNQKKLPEAPEQKMIEPAPDQKRIEMTSGATPSAEVGSVTQ